MKSSQDLRQIFSQRLDGELEGSAARRFDDTLVQNPELEAEYQTFAEVVQLINALPRPSDDPDFVAKVQRRIHRRRRSRRRGRLDHSPLPILGTLATLVALFFVAGLGFLANPHSGTIDELSASNTLLPPSTLHATMTAEPAQVLEALHAARSQELLQRVELNANSSSIKIVVGSQQLGALLDWLSQRAALHIGTPSPAAANSTVLEIETTP